MTKSLLPKVGYVKITRHGLVTLKTKRWSLKSTKLTVTDLCLSELPNRIAQSAARNNSGKDYNLLFKKTIAAYLENKYDLADYIWDIFIKYHMNVPAIVKIPNLKKTLEKKQLLPVLTIFTYNNKYGIHKIFKNMNKRDFKRKRKDLVSKIKAIQFNIPTIIPRNVFMLSLR